MSLKPIPDGYHTLTPFLTVRDAVRAIEFYKQAFGAQERGVMKSPDGKVMHAELKIGDSIMGPRRIRATAGAVVVDVVVELCAVPVPPPAVAVLVVLELAAAVVVVLDPVDPAGGGGL